MKVRERWVGKRKVAKGREITRKIMKKKNRMKKRAKKFAGTNEKFLMLQFIYILVYCDA